MLRNPTNDLNAYDPNTLHRYHRPLYIAFAMNKLDYASFDSNPFVVNQTQEWSCQCKLGRNALHYAVEQVGDNYWIQKA